MLQDETWAEAIIALTQVRDLDPEFRRAQVAEMLYTAHFEQGRRLLSPDQIAEALAAFQQALAEKPNDPEATVQSTRANLYQKGAAALADGDHSGAVRSLKPLYQDEPKYLDTADLLWQAYFDYGDELLATEEWCLAEAQYQAAAAIESTSALADKLDASGSNCQEEAQTELAQTAPETAAPTGPITATNRAAITSTTGVTPTEDTAPAGEEAPPPASAGSAQGNIIYSVYNPNETRWEILTIPAGGGTPSLLQKDGTMPAVSPSGQLLVYRSERQDAVGLHVRNLTTGADTTRATIVAEHILPRWEGGEAQFIFVAQDKANGRWQIYRGFADGKGAPVILADGRTPAPSPDGQRLAFQGTDPEGNNPGIYVMPTYGGESTRLTEHESDRSPVFSPDGSKIAYMSTQGGNWDVYVINSSGGTPRKITTSSGNDGLPVWSPDGSRLAYVSDQGGEWAIWTVPQGGGSPTKLTPWDGVNLSDWLMAQIWWSR